MIVYRGGGLGRIGCVGCLPLLLLSVLITVLVFALSGGQCTLFVFP